MSSSVRDELWVIVPDGKRFEGTLSGVESYVGVYYLLTERTVYVAVVKENPREREDRDDELFPTTCRAAIRKGAS